MPPSAKAAVFATPPPNITVVEVPTDVDCGGAIKAGTATFPAYLTSNTIVASDIASGVPVVRVGSAVFLESLAVAVDLDSPMAEDLTGTMNVFVGVLRSDGTLSQLSVKWFGVDLTNPPS